MMRPWDDASLGLHAAHAGREEALGVYEEIPPQTAFPGWLIGKDLSDYGADGDFDDRRRVNRQRLTQCRLQLLAAFRSHTPCAISFSQFDEIGQ